MPRNAEVIRQWSILRDLEASRRLTIDELSERTGVTTRTIRRDLEALQAAGFPLFDETHDGKKYWTLEHKAFRRLDNTAFTLAELSALYFSRTLVENLASTPFEADVRRAFEKLAGALTPGMRQFLDRLPLVMQAKADPGSQSAPGESEDAVSRAPRSRKVAQLLEATLQHRLVGLRYHSLSSDREKDYLVEPYRLVFAQGGLYLMAFVREYGELRTFAVERMHSVSLTEERFEPTQGPGHAFAHSLGVNQGDPERILVDFDPKIARFVRERVWHASQEVEPRENGGVRMALDVCNDWALQNWILGFGSLARVASPESLRMQILQELERARAQYLQPQA